MVFALTDSNTTFAITDTQFVENVALVLGGALYIYAEPNAPGSQFMILTSVVTFLRNGVGSGNETLYEGPGGAISIDCSVQSNVAVNLIDTTFEENKSQTGGALCIAASAATIFLRLNATIFTRNMAQKGGAIMVVMEESTANSVLVALQFGAFVNNTATKGAAMFIQSTHLSIESCAFEGNVVAEQTSETWLPAGCGGAVYVTSNTLTCMNSTFINNYALYGGALNVLAADTFLTGVTFESNTASAGGAVAFLSCGAYTSVQVVNVTFVTNNAISDSGSGIYLETCATSVLVNMVLEDTVFVANIGSALLVHTAWSNATVLVQILGGRFERNVATTASAIKCFDANLFISNSTIFADNELTGGVAECTTCGCCALPGAPPNVTSAPLLPGLVVPFSCTTSGNATEITCVDPTTDFLHINGFCFPCDAVCDLCTETECVACIAGYYLINGTCVACSSPCGTCDVNPANCTSCVTGWHFNPSLGICQTACAPSCLTCGILYTDCESCGQGMYVHDFACEPCAPNCEECEGFATNCTLCASGFGLGDKEDERSCLPIVCPTSCATCWSNVTCDTCHSNFALGSDSLCAPIVCPKELNCATCASNTTCSQCAKGFHLVSAECVPDNEWVLILVVVGVVILILIIGGFLYFFLVWRRRGYAKIGSDGVNTNQFTTGATLSITRTTVGMGFGDFSTNLSAAEVGVIPWNQLEIISELGQGGQGAVMHVRHVQTDTEMAMKITKQLGDANQVAFAMQEVRMLINLHHPHCLAYLGVTSRANEFAVLTEYMAGGDLSIASQRLPMKDRIRALLHAAKGLSYLHLQNIVHADIKPSNILLDDRGKAVLGDFGISGAFRPQGYTERFAAPEVIRDHEQQLASDIYSFALTVYAVLTQTQPFAHLDNEESLIGAPQRGRQTTGIVASWRAPQRRLRKGVPAVDGDAFPAHVIANLGMSSAFMEVFARAQSEDPRQRASIGEVMVALTAAYKEMYLNSPQL